MSEKIIYCYYQPNSLNRPGPGRFEPFSIEPNLCTHLGYYRFGVHENGIIRHVDKYLDTDENLIGRILHLRTVNPNLKIMAVFGGWDEGSEKFSRIAADPEYRALFKRTAVDFCRKYGFDGIDLDWCYPGKRSSSNPADKAAYSILVQELKEWCVTNSLLLFLSVGATRWTGDSSYDIPFISYNADMLILKTFDFHGAWEGTTGANTPLFATRNVNISDCVKYWIERGAPVCKLLLGLAFYGQTSTLENENKFKLGDRTIGKGLEGASTREPGKLAFYEFVNDGKWNLHWDDKRKVPYAHSGNQWISYDDAKSIQQKCEFVNNRGLGGVMVFSIDYDDFLGMCGTKYPLLNAVRRTLN